MSISRIAQTFSGAPTIKEENLSRFINTYGPILAEDYNKVPGKYIKPPEEIVKLVTHKIRNRGVGSITIDGPNWKATAKALGIKNTYKAWREFFGCN